jgi:hypothetical protein
MKDVAASEMTAQETQEATVVGSPAAGEGQEMMGVVHRIHWRWWVRNEKNATLTRRRLMKFWRHSTLPSQEFSSIKPPPLVIHHNAILIYSRSSIQCLTYICLLNSINLKV